MEFENFKYRLEKSDGMELSVQKTNRPKYEHSKVEFKTVFWCSRNGKKGSTGRGKKTGLSSCPCRLVVKKLKDSDFLEIEYINVHSHPTGIENVKHTNVSKSVREIVETALRAGYQKSTIQSLIEKDKSLKLRDRNISDKEFQRIYRRVELQRFGYHSYDSKSVAKWIEALEKTGELKSLKIGNNKAIEEIIIVPKLGEMKIGDNNKVLCLDSTHNTTIYGFSLFTLVAQNKFG